jgi:hypothetical protein
LVRILPSRSITLALAVAISICTVAALLVFSAQTMAQVSRAACSSSARAKHAAHACTQSRRTPKSSHGGKAHGHSKIKGHHPKHAAVKKAAAKAKPAKPTPALCADGSVPALLEGDFACDDESEPVCENGTTPMLSSSGTSLVCVIAKKKSRAASTQPLCEDGSDPLRAGDGSFYCDDESEPVCENGSEPAPSSNGASLLCGAAPVEESTS